MLGVAVVRSCADKAVRWPALTNPEEELHHAIHTLRCDLRNWDSSSRNLRKSILERFLWLHGDENGGAGIGAARERDSLSQHMSMTNLHGASDKHTEQKELAASPSSMLQHGLAIPTSLANASLESLYGAAASLLLMRITSWLRLTYTLRVANLLNLRAIGTFCADASGGLRFVHEFVEAGGILTLLSIIEVAGPAEKAEQASHERFEDHQTVPASNRNTREQQHRSSHTHIAAGGHSPHDSITAEAAAQHAADLERQRLAQESEEIEKERCLIILLRISTTGRAFKEMLCEQRGVAVVIQCLARVKREQTQEVAKQLLCQLGMGNPRYASLVHEELLSVFRAPSSNSCKRMVLQTLHFLLSHTPTAKEMGLAGTGGTGGLGGLGAASTPSLTAAIEYDAHGQPIDHFSADARYVEATVSLYHVQDPTLHYEANQLLKLLITRHGLQESTLQALLAILKQKTQNALNSPGGGGSAGGQQGQDGQSGRRSSRSGADSARGGGDQGSTGFGHGPESDNASNATGGGGVNGTGGSGSSTNGSSKSRTRPTAAAGGASSSTKHSDPKTCAVKMLNELALLSYELCLRMTQLGVIHLLLDCLCNMSNYELQHSSCLLLYTLNNNVVECASLIRYMMSGTTSQAAISLSAATSSSEGLYLEFLKSPEHLHRHLSYADVTKIQANLRHPPAKVQTAFLSQRRLERRNTGLMGAAGTAAGTAGAHTGLGARKNSINAGAGTAAGSKDSPGLNASGSSKQLTKSPALGPSGTASQSRKSSGTNFSFHLADPSAHQAHFNAAAANASAIGGAAGDGGSGLSPALHPFGFAPPSGLRGTEQTLEEEDARFFAHGMASIARSNNEADAVAAALRQEKQSEKDRAALAQALKEAQEKRMEDEPTVDPESQTDVVAQLQLAARRKLENLAFGRHNGTAFSPSTAASLLPTRPRRVHPDQISVPATELHFDPKLRLVDEGIPYVPHSKTLLMLHATGGGTGGAGGVGGVFAGVHEGASKMAAPVRASGGTATAAAAAEEKGPDGEPLSSGVYAPFAQAEQRQHGDDDVKDKPSSSRYPVAAGDAPSHLVFSQRVGLAPHRETPSDAHSDAYLASHFKDLMQPTRAAFLGHGMPGVAEQLQQQQSSHSHSSSSNHHSRRPGTRENADDDANLLLPDILPSVEVLSEVDSLISGQSKKTAEARQEELKRKRDEKRLKDAQAMAAAAHEHAQANKYYKATTGTSGDGANASTTGANSGDADESEYTGFTEKALPKEKKANEFSTKKALTMDQAANLLAQKKKLEAAAKAKQEEEAKQVGVLGKMKGGAGAVSSMNAALTAAAAASSATSNRQVLQLAMQLDGSGRTIDPRKWGAKTRGSVGISGDGAPTAASASTTRPGTHKSTTAASTKKVLPAHAHESPADRAEREAIEAQLAELRGSTGDADDGGHADGDLLDEDDDVDGGDGASASSAAKNRARDAKLRKMRRAASNSHSDDFNTPSSSSSTSRPATLTPRASNATSAASPPSGGRGGHGRARSMSLMVSNVSAGGAVGEAALASILASKDSPKFGPSSTSRESPRQVTSASGSAATTPRHQPSLPRSGSLRGTSAGSSQLGSMSMLSAAEHGLPSENDHTTAEGAEEPSQLMPTAALKRAPVNALGKPVVRRSTVMIPGSIVQAQQRPPLSPRPPAGAAAGEPVKHLPPKRANSLAAPAPVRPNGQPSAKSPRHGPSAVAQTARKVATTDFSIAE